MCGITGIFLFNDRNEKKLQCIQAATNALISRGPDATGIYSHRHLALGHRRLSIIDTSDASKQPFTDISGRYTIVFNGEIFNYQSLRLALKNKGVSFVSDGDTEVLLNLYIQDGIDCLTKLDGEFAFAIYDNQKEELFIARDRYGIKPLYYFISENEFVFGSELKALIEFEIPKIIDTDSLQTYLHLNYIPSPYSIFKDVFKLNAGSYGIINANDKFENKKYYAIPYKQNLSNIPTYENAQKELKKILETSVINRMISDVPLGTFLSGGIDSSIITCIASKQKKDLHTFSIGYKDEPFFDETAYANLVAKKFNTNHTVFQLSNEDLFQNLHHVLNYLDEPFADSSALAVNILSMHTKMHVTVALSGDGADELFAGYNKHAAEFQIRNGGFFPSLIKYAHPVLKQFPMSRNSRIGNKIRQMDKFAKGIKLSEKERYWLWAGFNAEETLLKNKVRSAEFDKRKQNILKNLNADYNSVLQTDMELVLENDMLVKVDRMSMSHSLEVRVPFLDSAVVDYAFSLPSTYKIDALGRKKILRDAFKSDLPQELYTRDKKGFEVPLLKWFQTELKGLITDDLLNDTFIEKQGIFDSNAVRNLKTQLFGNSPGESVAKVWSLIVFQFWWKKTFSNIEKL